MGFISSLFGCGQENRKSENKSDSINPLITKPVENISATDDQKERRAKSEKVCESNGVPIYKNPNSLFIAPEKELELRTKDEIVDRAIALLYLGLKSEGLEQVHLDKMEEDYGVSSKLSPSEKEYAYSTNPTNQQRTDANWRYESLHVLLWSLGYIDELIYPNQMCNVADDVKIIYELGPDKFRTQSKLRSKAEILDQADLILRLDWACVSARVKNEVAPGGLNSSVVYERHYALNWLIKYLNQDWDNISTDT
ncbi:DUF4272 domain-containing protein [Flammeovirga yaeyamensis]|uniref:DUF4272 domain-containing protein n=2 Tax=Flammeovirga yaeyamensis TaxID=367791 RepID=A0AAX1N8W7_9BACT|nr:DUF4272 domain-containing protein [Flammeovirga yaeyamensis]NMF38710.1 DUF4272 domain-containing protein [Flammeovirga yaeyamensis]QWG03912.1 DUF4272 domain-containing protein [Flammeovirga yaeyamensis]